MPGGPDRPTLGIGYKIIAHLMFAVMFASAKSVGPEVPIGQILFWRSGVGILVIVIFALMTGGIALLATNRIETHAFRSLSGVTSMFCNFSAFSLLPLADATAIGFAQPLFVVGLAALMLGEHVRIYRWSAVALGLVGVIIIVGPHAELGGSHLAGALFALAGAALSALAMIFLRRMSSHEHSITIAFYFMLTTVVLSSLSFFMGWDSLSTAQMSALVLTGVSGGIGQLTLSYSYRYAQASALAPFDYTALLWAAVLGYLVFGQLPILQVWIGAGFVIAAGLIIVWRERQLGKQRMVSGE